MTQSVPFMKVLQTAFCGIAFILFSTCLACPFCLAPSQTWSEMYAEADVVILGTLVSSDHGSDRKQPLSIVRAVKIARGTKTFQKGQLIQVPQPVYADVGSSVLLKGSYQDVRVAGVSDTFATDSDGRQVRSASVTSSETNQPQIVPASAKESSDSKADKAPGILVWDFAESVSQVAFEYITKAPELNAPSKTRLSYYLKHLEHSDELIAADAWGEFANARYEQIVEIKDQFPAEKLKEWITNAELSPERPGLYGMMLGLCGRPQDIDFLREQIGKGDRDDLRFGVEGLMGGLLVLSGDDGLDFLIESRLANPKANTSEVFSAMSAVKYAWEYESERFDKDRLRSSLRPLLEREEFQEIIITDLARWEDWSVMADLKKLCSSTEQAGVIRSTIGYCWQVQKSASATNQQKRDAASLLAAIKESHQSIYRRQLMYR